MGKVLEVYEYYNAHLTGINTRFQQQDDDFLRSCTVSIETVEHEGDFFWSIKVSSDKFVEFGKLVTGFQIPQMTRVIPVDEFSEGLMARVKAFVGQCD